MNCLSKEQISAYADGELAPEERARVEEHLASCAACRTFLEDIGALGEALKSHWQRKESSRLRRQRGCPAAEALAAFVAGSLRDTKECEKIALHIDGCSYCAMRAAEEIEAATLLEEANAEVSEPVPPYLAESVKKMFSPREPVRLGEIAVKLSELWERLKMWIGSEAGYGATVRSAYITKSFDMPAPKEYMDFQIDNAVLAYSDMSRDATTPRELEKPAKKKPPAGKPQKPAEKRRSQLKIIERDFHWSGLKIKAALYATRASGLECRITVLEAEKLPLSGVAIEMTEKGKTRVTATTDRKGSVRFPLPGKGRYSFLIRHKDAAVFDLDLK